MRPMSSPPQPESSQEIAEFFDGHSFLTDECAKGSALHIAVVGHNQDMRMVGGGQRNMASLAPVWQHGIARAGKGTQHIARVQNR